MWSMIDSRKPFKPVRFPKLWTIDIPVDNFDVVSGGRAEEWIACYLVKEVFSVEYAVNASFAIPHWIG